MLKNKRDKKGQVIFGEYLLVFFVVLGVITSMSVYVRRAMQARLRDARQSMFRTIQQGTTSDGGATFDHYNGTLYVEYEPYYGNRITTIDQSSDTERRLSPGRSSGIYDETINDRTDARSVSVQASPKEAK